MDENLQASLCQLLGEDERQKEPGDVIVVPTYLDQESTPMAT